MIDFTLTQQQILSNTVVKTQVKCATEVNIESKYRGQGPERLHKTKGRSR